jgi:predicted metal-dependent hydrolase
MKREITLGTQKVTYELTYKSVKNINVRIKSDGRICVSAARNVPVTYIDDFLMKKASMITDALDKACMHEYDETPYRQGGTVYYLGRPLAVRIEQAQSDIAIMDGYELVVYARSSDELRIRRIIEAWYDSRCAAVLGSIGNRVYRERFSEYVSGEPEYSYKNMKTLWGSCNPGRCRMSINKELIKYSEDLIEFVFCHEYTHFIHPDHSAAFYSFMSSVLPDHDRRRQRLKRESLLIRKTS